MNDFLYLNYGIKVDKIYKGNNELYFFYNNERIHIRKSSNEKYLNDLYELTNYLYNNRVFTYTFIHNNKNQHYTKKDDKYIVLLKENSLNEIITINSLKKYQNIYSNLDEYNIYDEWCKEVDIIEKELMEYNKEYPLIQESIDYYIGMAENAIELIDSFKDIINRNNNSIGHKLNYNLYNNMSINDPFTFIKVNKMYDYSNYIKYMFFRNNIDYNQIDNMFNETSEYERIYLFSCLIYPSTYFSLVKSVLLGEESCEKISLFIKIINDYNKLLYYCKSRVKSKVISNLLSWL